ncbi:hypothetical protein [Neobacillus sedimentimangrovi]|uniref:hypothetical protein n=1 Tax=Neobacillus sedimentimangrovi TaxID=2699460 RepID=UPI001F3F92BC|nr:hypothetical protein [Neobacillus sedimentimangrovi]
MPIKSGEITQFEGYSQFTCLKEFNTHFEWWMLEHKQKFSKGELIGIKRLARFAAKVPGVANAKIGTMLKAIHEEFNNNGISRSTFKRMIQKSIKLGILTVYETERKNGAQTSNLYVFNRFPQNELPKEEKLNHHEETINLLKTNHQKIRKETPKRPNQKENRSVLDDTYVSDRVPQPFVQMVKCFFPEAKSIEEFWKMAEIAAYRNLSEEKPERILETAIQAFRQLIRKLKYTQSVKNPFAYFYGIIFKKLRIQFYQDLEDLLDDTDEDSVIYRKIPPLEKILDWDHRILEPDYYKTQTMHDSPY